MSVYVPYRPGAAPRRHTAPPQWGVPYRPRGLGFLGDASTLTRSASAAYTGATVGTAAGSIVIGGATSVAGAVSGAAAAGSFVPVIGTAIGLIIGLIASGVFNHRVDPEVGNFNNAIALYNQQGVNGIMNIADKYLVLAGLFDLEPNQIKGNIPIYKKYGRMGEAKFVTDMVNLIYQAAQQGRITSNDTVQSVYNNVVAPWIASFGYGSMSDANGEMITNIIIGLIAEYITGLYKTRWFARGGDMPVQFQSLPAFALPAAATQTLAPSPSPPPVTPVSSLPPQALPTNSTPGPPPPTPGTPAWMLSAGYQIVGSDPTYGNLYQIVGSHEPPVVLMNGQVMPYPQQVPSISSQLPSAVTPPVQSVNPTVNLTPYMPQVQTPQYAGGGPVPYTTPASDANSTPVTAPTQSAGVSPWLIGGFAVMLLFMVKAKPDGSGQKAA